MGSSKRATQTVLPGAGLEAAVQGKNFQHFRFLQWRQDSREAGGQHGFPGTRRTTEDKVVTTAGGDFQRPFCQSLPPDFIQVGIGGYLAQWRFFYVLKRCCPPQEGAELQQMIGGNDPGALHQGGAARVHGGCDQHVVISLAGYGRCHGA